MTELTPEQIAYALEDIDVNNKIRWKAHTKHFYEGKSIMQWSKELDVSYEVLLGRMKRNNSIFVKTTRQVGERTMPNYQGHPRSYWAHQLGVTENYVYKHLKKYGNLDNCKLKRRKVKGRADEKYLDKTMTQWALELNCSTQWVIDSIRKHGNLDHLIAKQKLNKHAAK
jgi:hypothetical protein